MLWIRAATVSFANKVAAIPALGDKEHVSSLRRDTAEAAGLRVERLSINHGGSGERVLLVIHGNGAEAFLETNEEAVLFAAPGDSGPLLVVATPRAEAERIWPRRCAIGFASLT